jgi:hypothetical protein
LMSVEWEKSENFMTRDSMSLPSEILILKDVDVKLKYLSKS